MNKIFTTCCFTVAFFVVAMQAFAHATPISYDPGSSSVIEKTPERVRIHFSERIEPAASDMSVLGPDGTPLNMGDATADPHDSHFFGARMRDAGKGTYTVSWQVVSADDGHFTKGAFTFSVGHQTTVSAQSTGQIQIQHITTIPQASVMWMELTGQSLLLGVLLLSIGIWRPLAKHFGRYFSSDDTMAVERRMGLCVLAGVGLVLAGVVGLIVLKTLDLEQLRGSTFIPTLRLFLQTLDGIHGVARAILALAFGALFFLFRIMRGRKFSARIGKAALIAVSAAIVLSRARVGHSAATDFFPNISIGITAAHLLAKELWIGGLIVFTAALFPFMRRLRRSKAMLFSLLSFSKIISIALGIAGVTGMYIIWLDVKKPAYLFASEWGARCIILLIFASLLCMMRFINQLVLEREAARAPNENGKIHAIIFKNAYYAIALEAVIGLALLFTTSFLIITTPPFLSEQFLFEKHALSQGAVISFNIHPYEPDKFLVTVADNDASPDNAISDVTVQLTNEEKGVGPIVVQGEERFPGGYVIPRNSFSLPGQWRVNIIARRSHAFDAVSSFALSYPDDIDGTRVNPERHTFGSFEMLLLLGASGIAGAAWWLYRFSGGLQTSLTDSDGKDNDMPPRDNMPGLGKITMFASAGLILACGFVWFSYNVWVKTAFEKQCERDGNFWLQSVPMRDGVALSSETVTGCTLNLGLYHFPDEREYAFFTRPRQSVAQVDTFPATPIAGAPTRLIARITSIEHGQKTGPVQDLGIYHDRILHMIIVGEDIKTFAHIHTEDSGPVTDLMKKEGAYPLQYTFPRAGRYTIVVNYVQGGKELSQQSFLNVAGKPSMKKNSDARIELDNDHAMAKDIDGYHVTLDAPASLHAGSITKFTYTIEKDGKKLADLEPYLGAAMHIAIVRADLGRVIHAHGQPYLPGSAFFQQLFQSYVNYHSHFVPDHFGPDIQARLTFPQPGLYNMFGQFKHQGKVITSSFVARVE